MRRIWPILAVVLALLGPAAHAKSRPRPVSVDSGWSFVLADVVSAQVTIDLPSTVADHAQLRSEIRRAGARWTRDSEAFDPEPLASLGQSLRALVPVLGLHHCPDGLGQEGRREAQRLQVEVAIRTKAHGVLRVHSSSDCAYMLPWHVTNGESLAASYQPQTGQAIEQLIAPLCPECRMNTQPMPEPFVASREQIRYESLFGALVAKWKRLAVKDPAWVASQAENLTTALRWMDEKRFEAELRRLIGRRTIAPPVRRLAEAELQHVRPKNESGTSARLEDGKAGPKSE